MPPATFIDYYQMMQISPSAEAETVQRVYRLLSARYRPDNPLTGDANRFSQLNQAYKVLSDVRARAAYDVLHRACTEQAIAVFETPEFNGGVDGEALRRMGVLCLLYARRRSNADSPGISILLFEKLMSCPREHLMFAVWYLKEANLIRQDQASDFVITAPGADYVEKNLASYESLRKLLKSTETGEMERNPEIERNPVDADGAATPK